MSTLTSRLEALRSTRQFSPQLIDQFGAWIETAPEEALFRASPLGFARRSAVEERTAIDLFLYATHAGILEFSWGAVCPGCLGFFTASATLRALSQSRFCPLCRMQIPNAAEDVEVAFTVSPSVRSIRFHSPESLGDEDADRIYFAPSVQPDDGVMGAFRDNILKHVRLPAGGRLRLDSGLEAGRYLACVPAAHAVSHFTAKPGGAKEYEVELLETGLIPPEFECGAGVALELVNRTSRPVAAWLGRDLTPPPGERPCAMPPRSRAAYLTGQRLITSQAFRDLFRAESIPAQGGLELKGLAILFTDLKGSTEMYSRIGDLSAYDLVRQHFDLLLGIVAKGGGAVVKTIGDAIMASFSEPKDALAAAVEMHRAIRGVHGSGEELALKIGLHNGPCIAVDLNDRLDYFGQTVNLAARVQALAEAGEIVCSADSWGAQGVEQLARTAGLGVAAESASLKGITGKVPVVRLR